jgi:hypothetical protein
MVCRKAFDRKGREGKPQRAQGKAKSNMQCEDQRKGTIRLGLVDEKKKNSRGLLKSAGTMLFGTSRRGGIMRMGLHQLVLGAGIVSSVTEQTSKPIQFTDVTAAAGIKFVHFKATTGCRSIVRNSARGCASRISMGMAGRISTS